jgi:hypothetical protein
MPIREKGLEVFSDVIPPKRRESLGTEEKAS